MNELKQFYGEEYYNDLEKTLNHITETLTTITLNDRKMVEHIYGRIKSPESVEKKLIKKKLTLSKKVIKEELKDIVGIRVVCKFLNDVYHIVEQIKNVSEYEVIKEKDYIQQPKENGYRSYHLILQLNLNSERIYAEIQIRTISQDAWASLEHQMKYKKHITHEKLLVSELKRCADELASTDISMQTIYELIDLGD